MKENCLNKARITLTATIASAAVCAFSLCLIPFMNNDIKGQENFWNYIPGVLFWVGLLFTIVFNYCTKMVLFKSRKGLIRKGVIEEQRLPGIFSFSRYRYNLIVYGIAASGLVFMITDIIFGYIHPALMFPIISVTVLSIAIHCIIDGKYYKVYKIIKES